MPNHISIVASDQGLAQMNVKIPASEKAAIASAALRAGVPLRRYVLEAVRARLAEEQYITA